MLLIVPYPPPLLAAVHSQQSVFKSTFEFIPEGEPLEIIGFEDKDEAGTKKAIKKKKK